MAKKAAQRVRATANTTSATTKMDSMDDQSVAIEGVLAEGLTVGRRESASLFLFNKDESVDDKIAEEADRLENAQKAKELADAEQQRRIDEAEDRENELEIVRQINIEYSISAAQEEKERRMHEYEVAKVQEQLLRERNKVTATLAAETERQRRVSEADETHQSNIAERRQQQQLAVEAMEGERNRRLSSSEHRERATSSSSPCLPPLEDDEEATFSEIPVVHASSSKMVVDEHTKWRCYVQSDNPEQEKDNLRALRMSLEVELKDCPANPELVGDIRLLRFLRGHKQNVAVAATKFREMLTLRRKYNMVEIRNTIVTKSMAPSDFPGYDKIIKHLPFLHAYDLASAEHGHVFCFEMTGYADSRGLMDQVSDDEWMQFWLYDMEHLALKLDQLSRQSEKMVQTIVVRDLTGFSITRFQPRVLKRLYSVLAFATKCYPETTHETILLNTPWVFDKIWALILPKLHETQLRKIHMSGDAYAHLVELVGGTRDPLPKQLGGKNLTQVIPQSGFLGSNSYVLLCDDGATQAEIKAGGTLQLPFRICANDTLCWEYDVKAHDIEFSVKLRVQGEGGAVEVDKVSKTRVGAGNATIAGSYTATEEGTVVLSWDNSYSWTRSKSVAYKAKVVKATHDFSCLDISGNDCV